MTYQAINKIIGHEDAKRDLENALRSQSIPHSWLVTGPEGIGKNSLIYGFIQELFADIDGAFERISENTFGDFLEIKQEDGKDINVSDVREIGKFLSLTAGEGRYRVVLINGAEHMNHHGANSLLKILEEPPANSIIILIANNLSKLLPTIKSRCRHLKLHPLSKDKIELILDQTIDEDIYIMSEGSPGLAAELIKKNAMKLYVNFLNMLASKNVESLFKMTDFSENEENENSWKVVNVVINYLLANILKYNFAKESKSSIEEEGYLLDKIIKHYSMGEWFKIIDRVKLMLFEADLLNFDKKHTLLVIFNLLKGTR